jgi:hypothetical protein
MELLGSFVCGEQRVPIDPVSFEISCQLLVVGKTTWIPNPNSRLNPGVTTHRSLMRSSGLDQTIYGRRKVNYPLSES